MRDVERADEVSAGASVDDGELDAVEPRDAVDDLIDRAIPADGDEQARTSGGSVSGEVGEVTRPL